ncbi:hypothetical protein ACWZHB_01145 [Nocardia sp. FBN12]|uniref:hypothetical protein n=1 Tax=Nocardia sp. FBN12 TaxID=3419766 RepID=UPI003D040257
MTTIEHPAAIAAEAALSELAMHAERLVDRGSAVVVQLGSAEHEIIVLVPTDAAGFGAPVGTVGTFRRPIVRPDRTAEHSPIQLLTRKRATLPGQQHWWVISAVTAADAIGVQVTSSQDTHEAVPDAEGRVIAAVQVQEGEVPSVTVTTRDGGTVRVPPDYLGR